MNADHPISLLIYVTFGAALLIVGGAFLYFMRKRSNRHPMAGERERNIQEIRDEAPPQ